MEMISVSCSFAIRIPPAVSPPWIVVTTIHAVVSPDSYDPVHLAQYPQKEASVTKAVGARVDCVPRSTVTPTIP